MQWGRLSRAKRGVEQYHLCDVFRAYNNQRTMDQMKRLRYWFTAFLCVLVGLVSVTGCVPQGKAVGDTQEVQPAIDHDGVDISDVNLAVIGSSNAIDDTELLQACKKAGIHTTYINTQEVSNPLQAQTEGIEQLSEVRVTAFLVMRPNMQQNSEAWQQSLEIPRRAGIPVIVFDPVSTVDDNTLFAGVLSTNEVEGASQENLDTAIMSVIDDRVHDRTMWVSYNVKDRT